MLPIKKFRARDVLATTQLKTRLVRRDGDKDNAYLQLTTSKPLQEVRIDFWLSVVDRRGNQDKQRYLYVLSGSQTEGSDGAAQDLRRDRRTLSRRKGQQFQLGLASPEAVVSTSDYSNLWDVAMQLRAGYGVTVYQTMMAIYEMNRHAFGQENINTLLRGKELLMPTIDKVRSYGRSAAIRNVALMNYNFGIGPVDEMAIADVLRLRDVRQRPQRQVARRARPTEPEWSAPVPELPDAPQLRDIIEEDSTIVQLPDSGSNAIANLDTDAVTPRARQRGRSSQLPAPGGKDAAEDLLGQIPWVPVGAAVVLFVFVVIILRRRNATLQATGVEAADIPSRALGLGGRLHGNQKLRLRPGSPERSAQRSQRPRGAERACSATDCPSQSGRARRQLILEPCRRRATIAWCWGLNTMALPILAGRSKWDKLPYSRH